MNTIAARKRACIKQNNNFNCDVVSNASFNHIDFRSYPYNIVH